MISSIKGKTDVNKSHGAAVIGSTVAAIQTALSLAQMGVEVKVFADSAALGWDHAANPISGSSSPDRRFLWPLSLRMATHPLVTLYTDAEVESIQGRKGDFKIQVAQRPRYVHENLCTSCGRCELECSAKVTALLDSQKATHSAIHAPLLEAKAVPSAYIIDKKEPAPCRVACPLGINVQGFVSLLASGKTDRALELINEAAPLAGILGRVCRQPCELSCYRSEVDSPVSIRALHRYAADNALCGINYGRKLPARSRDERIAIVGSGPAGLTAAWELARLGYSPTVFESHGAIGGMIATAIPRFRLPREVREREIEAIKNLGIDIRTGTTVGRDVDFAYLRERGYQAFFLAIGTHRNTRLNIPGEELEGVVDCMSLLRTLNLMVDTVVGQNIVVIGDGNTAVDSARAAIRRNKGGTVKILSWTIPDELTAAREEIEEALQEGVQIEYRTVPAEILGDGAKVTGLHCQRTELTEEIMPNGRHRPRPIPGTDFMIEADHVVVAIGQTPDAPQLNMEGLAVDSKPSVIKVNPLTLETSIPGVFAGGDCTTGPNNVVEAMAAGLRAAESIDRYIQGRDLEAGRSLKRPKTAEIDIKAIEVSPSKRASMPTIPLQKRTGSFEETTRGLSSKAAQKEAQRCLNCALCSDCMECVRVCESDAVFHDDATRRFEVGARVILRFPSDGAVSDSPAGNTGQVDTAEGIRTVFSGSNGQLTSELTKAMAVALETAIDLKPKAAEQEQVRELAGTDTNSDQPRQAPEKPAATRRIGVFLCRCGGSISSVINFRTVARKLSYFPRVSCVLEVAQACTEAGAKQIAGHVAEWELDDVVIAACRCCNLEQVCYSCTDRRRMCYQYLNEHLILPRDTTVEFVNIREHCAWAHKEDPKGATRKAVQIISSGFTRDRLAPPTGPRMKSILPSALILGGGLTSITAAKALASQGYRVEVVAGQELKQTQRQSDQTISPTPEQSHTGDMVIKPWPDTLRFHGSPGSYEAVLEYGSEVDCVTAGAVLVDMAEVNNGGVSPLLSTIADSGLLGRIMSRASSSGSSANVRDNLLRELTIEETPGLFLLPSDGTEPPDDQVLHGLATAARVSTYLGQASIRPRASAVTIDSTLCRGCGECARICPYIEMQGHGDGTAHAYVDEILCLGCGACITICPTGAITQPSQSDKQIISTLRSMLHPGQMPRAV